MLGGAINHQGSQSASLTIGACTFSGNAAGCKGGAIYARGVRSVNVDGTTFRDGSTAQSLATAGEAHSDAQSVERGPSSSCKFPGLLSKPS